MQDSLCLGALRTWCPPGIDDQHLQGHVHFEMEWAELRASRSGIIQNSNFTPGRQFPMKTILPAVKVF